MVFVGKLMMISINGVLFLIIFVNFCFFIGEVENLREIIFYISLIKKDILLNVI